jgi:hypothetical protein
MQYQRAQELEREFDALIALIADMITAQAKQHVPTAHTPAWMFSQHDLAKKLFRHMCSVRSLLEPSPFRNQVIPSHSFIDHSSVAVLTRSAIENYLVMTWLHSTGSDWQLSTHSCRWSKLTVGPEAVCSTQLELNSESLRSGRPTFDLVTRNEQCQRHEANRRLDNP